MSEETILMKAIVVTDQDAGTAGMTLVERSEPLYPPIGPGPGGRAETWRFVSVGVP